MIAVQLLTFNTHAVGVVLPAEFKLTIGDLGFPGYDSDIDGFGLIVNDFDLGVLHPDLVGITVDVTTTNVGGNARITIGGSDGTMRIRRSSASVTYAFSGPVSFYFASGHNGAFDSARELSFFPGEFESFSGSPGTFTPLSPTTFNPNLTVSGGTITNNGGTAQNQGFNYGFTSGTQLTWTYGDVIPGGINDTSIQAWLVIPEPTAGAMILLATVFGMFHCRRKA
ncbi:MAG: hypothetical protein AAGJ79_09490 [Verrucomicrobiota bacterium]